MPEKYRAAVFLVVATAAIAGVVWMAVVGKWFELAVLAFCCIVIWFYDRSTDKQTQGTSDPPQAWIRRDRGNPLRGRSPLFVFFATLVSCPAFVGLCWVLTDGDDVSRWLGPLIVWAVIWFNWVWRA